MGCSVEVGDGVYTTYIWLWPTTVVFVNTIMAGSPWLHLRKLVEMECQTDLDSCSFNLLKFSVFMCMLECVCVCVCVCGRVKSVHRCDEPYLQVNTKETA